jgi:hypothetical protein
LNFLLYFAHFHSERSKERSFAHQMNREEAIMSKLSKQGVGYRRRLGSPICSHFHHRFHQNLIKLYFASLPELHTCLLLPMGIHLIHSLAPIYTKPAATNVADPTASNNEETHEIPLAIDAAVSMLAHNQRCIPRDQSTHQPQASVSLRYSTNLLHTSHSPAPYTTQSTAASPQTTSEYWSRSSCTPLLPRPQTLPTRT